jgi:hypothetical protein
MSPFPCPIRDCKPLKNEDESGRLRNEGSEQTGINKPHLTFHVSKWRDTVGRRRCRRIIIINSLKNTGYINVSHGHPMSSLVSYSCRMILPWTDGTAWWVKQYQNGEIILIQFTASVRTCTSTFDLLPERRGFR